MVDQETFDKIYGIISENEKKNAIIHEDLEERIFELEEAAIIKSSEKARLQKLAKDLNDFVFNYSAKYTEQEYSLFKKTARLIKKVYGGD